MRSAERAGRARVPAHNAPTRARRRLAHRRQLVNRAGFAAAPPPQPDPTHPRSPSARLTPAEARRIAQAAEDQAGSGRAVTLAEAAAMLDLARALAGPSTPPRDRRG